MNGQLLKTWFQLQFHSHFWFAIHLENWVQCFVMSSVSLVVPFQWFLSLWNSSLRKMEAFYYMNDVWVCMYVQNWNVSMTLSLLRKNWEAPQKETYFRTNRNNISIKESPLGRQLSSNRWNIWPSFHCHFNLQSLWLGNHSYDSFVMQD